MKYMTGSSLRRAYRWVACLCALAGLGACDATSGFVIESREPIEVAVVYEYGGAVDVPLDGKEADAQVGDVFRYVVFDTNVVHIPEQVIVVSSERTAKRVLLWREAEGRFCDAEAGECYLLHERPRSESDFDLFFYRRLTLFENDGIE